MSGFLSRLAERAVGASPLVEPRLRSRFEPDAQFTVTSPMEIEEFLDVLPADLARPGAERRAPTAPAGSSASMADRAASATLGTSRRPAPATLPVRGTAPRREAQEDVAPETAPARVERRVEPVFPPRAPVSEQKPARPPRDIGATKHAPQLAARAGADPASVTRPPLAVETNPGPTPIAAHGAQSDAVAYEDRGSSAEQLVTGTGPERDDLVFAADISVDRSRFLDGAPPVGEVPGAVERPYEPAMRAAVPAASTHVRSAKTTRHEVRRPAMAAMIGDHDSMDRAATGAERSTRRMDRAESMGLERAADSEAVVHVRIGRIDVRAATPPPPALQRSAEVRVESLDDYLKRTSGRK
jgi:hypothetical protein